MPMETSCFLLLIGMTAARPSLVFAEIGLALTGVGMGLATGPLMGATVGVAALGAVYAVFKGGPGGLCFAMSIGGVAQLAGAAYTWGTTARRSG